MTILMRLCGDGRLPGFDGLFLADFNFEAHDGQGEIAMTADPASAKQFASFAEAVAFRARQPTNRPLRPDGLPNRPLTATAWEIVSLESLDA